MAAGVVSTLPVVIAFFATQRWLVRGHHRGGGEGMTTIDPQALDLGGEPDAAAFPPAVRFGAATAAFQIEGAVARGRARRVDLGSLLRAPPARSPTATPATSPATTTTAGRPTST